MSSRKGNRELGDRRPQRDRRGGGGRSGGDVPREVQVSKKLSWLLRHGAEKEGLKLGDGGFVSVQDVLATRCIRTLKVTFPELRAAVLTNDKQRYSLKYIGDASPPPTDSSNSEDLATARLEALRITEEEIEQDDEPAHWLIRANQGHSLKVDSAGLLTPIQLTDGELPGMVVHGTTARAWELIQKAGGLKPMGRNHVHFATGLPAGFKPLEVQAEGEDEGEAARPPVISGMRNSSSVLIYIDVEKALKEGLPLWRSANDVVLSEGMKETRLVPLSLFKRVETRGNSFKDGPKVVMEDGVLV